MLEIFLSAFATFFVIMDPIGLAAISIGLLDGKTRSQKTAIIWRAVAVAWIILLFFALIGESFLERIGISMSAFRISGGVLLFLTALDMLFGSRVERRQSVEGGNDPAVYPLAMPLIAGPGSMTAIILLMGEQSGNWMGQALVLATMSFVLLMCAVLMMITNRFSHHLGQTGIQMLNRFLAILLAALAAQFIVDGIIEVMSSLNV